MKVKLHGIQFKKKKINSTFRVFTFYQFKVVNVSTLHRRNIFYHNSYGKRKPLLRF